MCNSNLYVVDSGSTLFSVDPVTASANKIGSVGFGSVTDIACYKGTIYGITYGEFLLIDPNTGRGAIVGPTGFNLNGLAVNSKGEIFASGLGGEFVSIDPTTGSATLIGFFGSGYTSSGDLAFDSNDRLYAALSGPSGVDICIIDVSTGTAYTQINTGLPTVYGLAFCCCNFYAADQDGILYEVNLGQGILEAVGKTGVNIWGMTCACCC